MSDRRRASVLPARIDAARMEAARIEAGAEAQPAQDAAEIFHDLRAPILASKTALSVLEDASDLERVAWIGYIQKQLDQALELMQLAKDPARGERISIAELLEEVRQTVALRARQKPIQVTAQATDQDDVMVVSRMSLRRVLLNLALNAVLYTERGSVVVGARRDGPRVKFFVRDTGIGMDKYDGPFQPTGARGHHASEHHPDGQGLGLKIVAALVTELGGVLHLTTTPKVGSEFSFTLDGAMTVSRDHEQVVIFPLSTTNDPGVSDPSQPRVLVADDDEHIRGQLYAYLSTRGYRVDLARDGVMATMAVQSREYDYVITDLEMPRLGGEGLHSQVRAIESAEVRTVSAIIVRSSREDAKLLVREDARTKVVHKMQSMRDLLALMRSFAPPLRHILVVEDDANVLEMTTRLVTQEGRYRTFAARDIPSALQIARKYRIDIALLDVQLGDASGLVLARELRVRHGAMLPLVATSAYSMAELRELGPFGFDAAIAKGFSRKQILDLIETLLHRRRGNAAEQEQTRASSASGFPVSPVVGPQPQIREKTARVHEASVPPDALRVHALQVDAPRVDPVRVERTISDGPSTGRQLLRSQPVVARSVASQPVARTTGAHATAALISNTAPIADDLRQAVQHDIGQIDDPDILRRLPSFLNNRRAELSALKERVDARTVDATELRRTLHRLKGTVATYGLLTLAHAIKDAEHNVEDDRMLPQSFAKIENIALAYIVVHAS